MIKTELLTKFEDFRLDCKCPFFDSGTSKCSLNPFVVRIGGCEGRWNDWLTSEIPLVFCETLKFYTENLENFSELVKLYSRMMTKVV
ncbi:MAG: hypothetical protein ACE5K0_01200 [Candidatus Methanofastidiosia archaeon]